MEAQGLMSNSKLPLNATLPTHTQTGSLSHKRERATTTILHTYLCGYGVIVYHQVEMSCAQKLGGLYLYMYAMMYTHSNRRNVALYFSLLTQIYYTHTQTQTHTNTDIDINTYMPNLLTPFSLYPSNAHSKSGLCSPLSRLSHYQYAIYCDTHHDVLTAHDWRRRRRLVESVACCLLGAE